MPNKGGQYRITLCMTPWIDGSASATIWILEREMDWKRKQNPCYVHFLLLPPHYNPFLFLRVAITSDLSFVPVRLYQYPRTDHVLNSATLAYF